MELLIIRSADQYIRVKDGEYLRVGLDKASVFPMDQLAVVRNHAAAAAAAGCPAICLKKLVLTEEEFAQ
jgi:hypothetical protein